MIRRPQVSNEVFEKLFAYTQGKPVHRTRNVHHEYVFSGRDLGRVNPLWGLYHEEEEVFCVSFVQEQSSFYLATGQAIFQDKIAIATMFFRLVESDGSQGWPLVVDIDLVRRTSQLLDRQAGCHVRHYVKTIGRRFSLVKMWIFYPFFRIPGLVSQLVGIPGPHDGRINELIHGVGRNEQLGILELHLDDF